MKYTYNLIDIGPRELKKKMSDYMGLYGAKAINYEMRDSMFTLAGKLACEMASNLSGCRSRARKARSTAKHSSTPAKAADFSAAFSAIRRITVTSVDRLRTRRLRRPVLHLYRRWGRHCNNHRHSILGVRCNARAATCSPRGYERADP